MGCTYTVLEARAEGTGNEERFIRDVLRGLGQEPQKTLPCKYIYDHAGSELFRRIMGLPEYYLTRCETEILKNHAPAITSPLREGPLNVVELGAGDGAKTRILLSHLLGSGMEFSYVPIDISESAIRGLASDLSQELPGLSTHGLVAEYSRGINWLSCREGCRNLVLFLGSSIGNLSRDEAVSFLRSLRDAMGQGDFLLLGLDLVKEPSVLNNAYNDSQGVTAQFNLNLLRRINRELGGEFDLDRFSFHAAWEPERGAVRSYLTSNAAHEVHIQEAGRSFSFKKNEPIHTESSHKYTPLEISRLARETGFEVEEHFHDSREYFLDSLWRAV